MPSPEHIHLAAADQESSGNNPEQALREELAALEERFTTITGGITREEFNTADPEDIARRLPENFDIEKLRENIHTQQKLSAKLERLMNGASLENAVELLGAENVHGPDDIKTTFGVTLEDIPAIPFSEAELERAAELGQMLVLRTDTDQNGEPLSIEKMQQHLDEKWERENKGRLLYNENTVTNLGEAYKQAPTPGWALVSKETVPDTKDRNYLEQTDTLLEHLKTEVFRDQDLPPEYKAAEQEFNQQRPEIEQLITNKQYTDAAEKLLNLDITQLTRPSATETIYDLALHFDATGTRLLPPGSATWTRSRASDGHPIDVGAFDDDGVHADRGLVGNRYSGVGARLSRSG